MIGCDIMDALSFTEIVDKFTKKFGVEWCANKLITEFVVSVFIDYLKSMPEEQFDYERVNCL